MDSINQKHCQQGSLDPRCSYKVEKRSVRDLKKDWEGCRTDMRMIYPLHDRLGTAMSAEVRNEAARPGLSRFEGLLSEPRFCPGRPIIAYSVYSVSLFMNGT